MNSVVKQLEQLKWPETETCPDEAFKKLLKARHKGRWIVMCCSFVQCS